MEEILLELTTPAVFVIPSRRPREFGIFLFPSPCKGEDEGEGPYAARIFRARFKILPRLTYLVALPARTVLATARFILPHLVVIAL
jgi:hypothetical protein